MFFIYQLTYVELSFLNVGFYQRSCFLGKGNGKMAFFPKSVQKIWWFVGFAVNLQKNL